MTCPMKKLRRLGQRAVAYVSCAIYDAAIAVGVSCQPSPIPNGMRPAWLIPSERSPVSLTLSDIDLEDKTCQLSVGPVLVLMSPLQVNHALLTKLGEGFKAKFSEINV